MTTEERRVYMKEYRQKNIQKQREYYRDYYKKNKKKYRISDWKRQGIISEDYEALYDRFISTDNCQFCEVALTEDKSKTKRCLDHDHETGLVRGVLCNSCNRRDVLQKE